MATSTERKYPKGLFEAAAKGRQRDPAEPDGDEGMDHTNPNPGKRCPECGKIH